MHKVKALFEFCTNRSNKVRRDLEARSAGRPLFSAKKSHAISAEKVLTWENKRVTGKRKGGGGKSLKQKGSVVSHVILACAQSSRPSRWQEGERRGEERKGERRAHESDAARSVREDEGMYKRAEVGWK